MELFPISALYAIANIDELSAPTEYVAGLLKSGVIMIQLRAKKTASSELAEIVRRCIEHRDSLGASRATRAQLIINDDIELCKTLGADGVHLGQNDPFPETARSRLGEDAVIGLSTHAIEHIRAAPVAQLSYLAIGPIFESSTKSGHAPLVGLETLAEAAQLSQLPLVAVGGITAENVEHVYRAGADSAAVVADLAKAEDLHDRVKLYFEAAARVQLELAR